ncbi:MAG: hypothetical protein IT436_13685 [Phycisphaerales bacterium]|nr:hypothetical protein [Phycisphaerales bacterium]
MSTTPPPTAPRSSRLFTGFLILACAALCILVVLLSQENRRLKSQSLTPAAAPGRPPALKPGDHLAPLTLIDKSGRAADFTFAAPRQRTLILAVGGGCPHCATTLPIWNDILRQVASPAVRIVGIQVEAESPDKLEPLPADFEINAVRNPRHTWLYALPMVPATLIAGPGGDIEHAWFGELSEAQQEELRSALIEASAGDK